MNLGGGIMLTPRFGFGAEVSFKPRQSDYAGLGYRPMFYDFNGILHPIPSSQARRAGTARPAWAPPT